MSTVVLVLIEVLIVIALSRLMGVFCRVIKQPLVIGEIIAGIMLGPSLLGAIAPDFAAALFPSSTLPFLEVLAQIGLIFFMFLIGLELNPKYLKSQLEVALMASHFSIIVPFCLGGILALLLYPLVSNDAVSFTAFALFLGAAMSITAFPVLARIITENNLQGTRLGTLALTCAAVDDVTAWCLLAGVIAVTRTNSAIGAIPTILQSIVYIAFMFTAGRWLLDNALSHYRRAGRLSQLTLAFIYMGVVLSALITEYIGIHLIFGAFLIGAAMPKDSGFVREIAEKTEDFILIFLLPVFFAYSGLRTQIGLIDRLELWLLCLAVLIVAILGKYVGTYAAARLNKINHRDASALGWLMNTRGLTELIVLNIGLSLGIISPLLFTMLVIMALVTTFMTSPLLEWTYPKDMIRLDTISDESLALDPEFTPSYRVLVPIANPNTQQGLVQLAAAIAGDIPAIVNPLSLIELEEDYIYQTTPIEVERLLQKQREKLDTLVQTLEPPEIRKGVYPMIQISHDVARATAQIAETDRTDLVLVGWHRPAFSDNRLGGRVGKILNIVPVDVAVFVDKERSSWKTLLVPYSEHRHDDLGLSLALRMLLNDADRHLKVLRLAGDDTTDEFSYEFRNTIDLLPPDVRSRVEISVLSGGDPIQGAIDASRYADLTIAGTSPAWGIERQTLGRYTDRLARECYSSVLITRRYSQVTYHVTSRLEMSSQSLSSPMTET
jgi:Kef-type K+ transport system membrane component KefB/nucleotide-binding universal stress UspA family protein